MAQILPDLGRIHRPNDTVLPNPLGKGTSLWQRVSPKRQIPLWTRAHLGKHQILGDLQEQANISCVPLPQGICGLKLGKRLYRCAEDDIFQIAAEGR